MNETVEIKHCKHSDGTIICDRKCYFFHPDEEGWAYSCEMGFVWNVTGEDMLRPDGPGYKDKKCPGEGRYILSLERITVDTKQE